MTFDDAENLPEVSRDISPSDLKRDDELINRMAYLVEYARDAHRIVEQVAAWQVRGNGGNGSQYAFISVPGDIWDRFEQFSKRERPDLLDEADELMRRYQG